MAKFVAGLSPAEVAEQQEVVRQHVQQEVTKQNLNDAQAALLLAQTLEHNGLPQLVQSPGKLGTLQGETRHNESMI